MAEQLRSMQRQLAALSALPAVLQQSLSIVNENLSRMLPKEREDVAESYLEYEDEEDYCSERNEEDYTDEVTTEEDSSFREPTPHDYGSLDNSRQEVDQESDPEYEPDPEYESEPEPTQEELEKINKLRKLKELNRVWPWSDNIKPVYKISDRYKVPHSELFSNRIQTLEKRMAERKPKQLKEGRS